MSVVRVVFMGTPEFAKFHLESLLGDDHFSVVGVVSQPDRKQGRKMRLTPSPVKALALESSIPVLTPEKFNSEDVFEQVASWKPEVIVVVAYGQIISSKFLNKYPDKVFNVHGSLLPQWRGAAPIQRALEAGDKTSGVCLQVMVRKLDAGAVLGERKISLDDKINAIELHDKLKVLGAELLHIELMDYIRGNLSPVPQDEEKVTYAHKLDKSESLIDWSRHSLDIHNKIRGFVLGPGCFSKLSGKKVKIHKTRILSNQDVESIPNLELKKSLIEFEPGEVVAVGVSEVVVKCGEQSLLGLLVIQPESKPRLKVIEFLKGNSINQGDRFGI